MKYIVERDLFMSKLQNYLNEMDEKGYDLVDVFVSEQDIKDGKENKYQRASKVTVIMSK
ncbi:hypothetical protein [Anaerofustis stercorihominis]|uniref:DUF4177 domain-containing protein n=1 Tax=Anaerofustis stercorihominis DSM 17244 TaxID=445971 RepID=B1C846_9FIRM|nr:hypothetical protein [Anaerofustis stercorihominis]EDS73183.1 hypothetical protein ANASTE_00903 [Anaerofustis stercorihominis DSM 17244]MCQ4794486.1 hypothetical protein [Anaerofustis stercorihominis]MCR2033533.1 hypothetical protein [Anaerofustis stercorihominis]